MHDILGAMSGQSDFKHHPWEAGMPWLISQAGKIPCVDVLVPTISLGRGAVADRPLYGW